MDQAQDGREAQAQEEERRDFMAFHCVVGFDGRKGGE